MILDPEMRTLLKQLADNTGRLTRAMEDILDASEEEQFRKDGAELKKKLAGVENFGIAGGGRMDLEVDEDGDALCPCEACVARRAKNT